MAKYKKEHSKTMNMSNVKTKTFSSVEKLLYNYTDKDV